MNISKYAKPTETVADLDRYYFRPSLFDDDSENEFYKILRDEILGERFVAIVQAPVPSLIHVHRQKEPGWHSHFGRIARKRIDFLICEKGDLRPRLAIELDGLSHLRFDRQERDAFVDEIFSAVGFPLLRVQASRHYNKVAIALEIAQRMKLEERVIKRLQIRLQSAL